MKIAERHQKKIMLSGEMKIGDRRSEAISKWRKIMANRENEIWCEAAMKWRENWQQ